MWKQHPVSVIFASSLPGRSKWYTWKSRDHRVWLVAVKNSIAGEISYRLNAHGHESVFFYVKLKWSRWDSFKLFLLYLFKGKMSKRNNNDTNKWELFICPTVCSLFYEKYNFPNYFCDYMRTLNKRNTTARGCVKYINTVSNL